MPFGVRLSTLRGFLAEIRFIPMTLCLLTTLLGGFFAVGPNVNWSMMGLVVLNAFLFLYTAHCNDTYFDLRKGEYEEGRTLHAVRLNSTSYLARWGFGREIPNAPLLLESYYLASIVVCALLGLIIMVYVSSLVGWMYSALAIGGLVLALTYSAGLDKVPALGDTMWEIGVILALWCGYYSQKLVFDMFIVLMSVPLFLALVTVKAQDSLPDTIVDDKIGKITLTVFLYRKALSLTRIRDISFAPIYAGFIILLTQAPPPIQLGVIITLCLIALNHVALRGVDREGRKTIVALGFTIIFFIVWSMLSIAGVIGL